MAVYFGLVQPGETVLGPRLDHGGHLTHGSPVNFSGKYYKIASYGVHPETHLIEEAEVMRLAREHQPKLIICGMTAYSRQIDFKMFRRAADEVGAKLMADVSHYAGLIVGGAYDNPTQLADVVTTTTHKTLRGPRGGLIMMKSAEAKAINKMIFPGIQGGPLMHQVAAKAVAFKEAQQPEFHEYAKSIVRNARALADGLMRRGLKLVSGGTDSHVMIIDLRGTGRTGAEVENALSQVGITVNKNTVPNDPEPPAKTSGIRLGTPAITSRGFGAPEMEVVADCIVRVVEHWNDDKALATIREQVVELCKRFPLFPHRLKDAVPTV